MFYKKPPNSVNTWVRIKESPKLYEIVDRKGAFEMKIKDDKTLRDLAILIKEIRAEKKKV